MALPAGVVTFVFTDIEGSTALFHELADEFLAVLDVHNRILREAWAAHGGVEVKTEGDAFFVAFADPAAAVAACVDGQRALASTAWPHGRPVRVRIGMHTGPVEVVDDDYVGLSVAEAARTASAAHGGQVLVSEATAAAASTAGLPDGVGLHDLGTHALKDFPQPRRLFQVTHPDLPAAFPAPRTLTARSHNLPSLPTPLVGRGAELRQVQDLLLHTTRLVTVTGPGGIGKSRLTIEAGWTLLSWFREGAWFVSLAHLASPDDIAPAIAAAVGVKEVPGRSLHDGIVARFSNGPALLVLDNFEHLLDGAPLVSDLLAACPELRVLASSRERLRLRGEHRIGLEVLPGPDARELFVQRARAVEPTFEGSEEVLGTVDRICTRLDGIPLAIELAAARLADVDVAALEVELDDVLGVLVEGERDLPARQQTLRATIDWSYRLLGDHDRSVLHAAAVFAGRGATDALAMVHGGPTAEVAAAEDALVAKSLLQRGLPGVDGGRRWWLLQTIREFVEEKAADDPAFERHVAAHVAWFRSLASSAAARITGPTQAEQVERLRQDVDNVRVALARLDGDGLLALAADLGRFWFRAGLWEEGAVWLARALDRRTADARPGDVAMAAMASGAIAQRRGDADRAGGDLELAVRAAEDSGDGILQAECLVQLAELRRVTGDAGGAVDVAMTAAAVAAEAGDDRVLAAARNTLGAIAYNGGDPAEAETQWEAAAAAAEHAGDDSALGSALNNLGLVARARGDAETAERRYRERLAIARRVGDVPGAGMALYNLGSVLQERERSAEADEALREAQESFEALGDRRMEAWCRLGRFMRVDARTDDPDYGAAVRWAHGVFSATGDARGLSLTQAMLDDLAADAAAIDAGAGER